MKIDGVYHCSDVAFEAGLYPAKVGLCRYTDCQNILATALSYSCSEANPANTSILVTTVTATSSIFEKLPD